jgi:hypothetical protein
VLASTGFTQKTDHRAIHFEIKSRSGKRRGLGNYPAIYLNVIDYGLEVIAGSPVSKYQSQD